MYRLLVCLPLCLALEAAPPPRLPPRLPVLAIAAATADTGDALPGAEDMERLARTDPIAFVRACIRRYDREVKGYNVTLLKTERIAGKLYAPETIAVQFREQPFSVFFDWKAGARQAKRTLYVRGENNDKLLVKPAGLAGLIGIVERDADGADARKGGRYPLTEFGMKYGMQRTIAAWTNASKQNSLHVAYLGVKPIKELGERSCYVLQRTRYRAPEEDGVSQYTTYIDKETWLQTGSILKRADGELVAEYFFTDIELNPAFKDGAFTRASLSR